jgi:hypothetical protein
MRRLLAKRWLWCLAVVLVVVLCPLPLLYFWADPYYRVREGMTGEEVERILGPTHTGGGITLGLLDMTTDYVTEIRYRSWDVLTIRYRNDRVVEKARAAHPMAELWQELLDKVGLAPGPFPPAVVPVTPPPPPPFLPAPLPLESPDTETPAPEVPP